MFTGQPPFEGKYVDDIEVSIESGKVNFDSIEWDNISSQAKKFILRLLEKDPNQRVTADEAIQDPWITKMSTMDSKKINTDAIVHINTNGSLKNFNAKLKLQHACIAFIVHQMSCNEQTKDLRKIFSQMDVSGEGKLSIDELREGYNKFFSKKSSFSQEDFEKIIVNFAQNNEDFIEYEDFLRATLSMDVILTEKNLELAFQYFDTENKGYLTKENLETTFGVSKENSKENEIIKNILNEVDANGDGSISFKEFKSLMKKTLEKVGR